jgi:hypothetical protein
LTYQSIYISSLPADNDFNRLIRSHWSVENNLHWTLDIVFGEDEQRKRANHAAKNFAIVKKITLNLLKKDTSEGSLQTKRLKVLICLKFKCVDPVIQYAAGQTYINLKNRHDINNSIIIINRFFQRFSSQNLFLMIINKSRFSIEDFGKENLIFNRRLFHEVAHARASPQAVLPLT